MPNGGSDNCSRCGFNRYNNWQWKFRDGDRASEKAYCEIRELEIPNPFFSYCVNWHTQKLEPEGPVYSAVQEVVRLPWVGELMPVGIEQGRCVVCSEVFESQPNDWPLGVVIVGDGGVQFQFCSDEHYLMWWRKKYEGQRLPFYDYMPHSRTQDQVADEWRAAGVNIRRHWWEFWKV